jgi:hypothetical protein
MAALPPLPMLSVQNRKAKKKEIEKGSKLEINSTKSPSQPVAVLCPYPCSSCCPKMNPNS